MGIWSSLWNGVKKVAETVVVVASAPIVIPAALAFGAAESMGLISSEASKEVEKVGAMTDSSSTRQVEKVHEVLTVSNEKYLREAEKIEEGMKRYVNECFDSIVIEIKKNTVVAESMDMERLEYAQKQLCGSINGIITKKINAELTIDNNKIRDIMSKGNNLERKNAYEKYANGILREARLNAAEKCKTTLSEQMEYINKFLNGCVDKQNAEAERMKKRLDEIVKAKQEKTYESEKINLQPKIKMYILDEIEKIMVA